MLSTARQKQVSVTTRTDYTFTVISNEAV